MVVLALSGLVLLAASQMPDRVMAQTLPPCTGPGGGLVAEEINGCGGYGGGATTNATPGTGGESSPTGSGVNGQAGIGTGGGGGGGSGVNGGNGGSSAAGGAGGTGATSAGGNGGNATGPGGGGGGGAHGAIVTTSLNNATPISGGAGGNGMAGSGTGGGGGGGAGGYGLVMNGSSLTVTNNAGGSITGGNGGTGGNAGSGTVGEGGDGGRGLEFVSGGSTLTNSGAINGGGGGNSGTASSNTAAFPEGGNGGAGVAFLNGGVLTNSGSSSSISGGNGGDASTGTNSLGGNGGAGVMGLNVGISNDGTIEGGNGGNGGRGGIGQGAKGGAGVTFSSGSAAVITNNGTIQGGDGGAGRAISASATAAGDGGGAGGAGIDASNLEIINNTGASIAGGAGGAAGVGAAGAGGIGIGGSNLTIYNGGAISGGVGGGVQANAITFTGGNNYLELRFGYVVNGNVVDQTGAGTLALGGDSSPASPFDASSIGPMGSAVQYRGFSSFVKTGASTWQLTGVPLTTTPWTIQQGTLAISSDQNLGAAGEVLTFDSNGGLPLPVLRFDGSDIALNRAVELATDGTFDTFGNDATVSGQIGGDGALIKTGDGTLTLTGTNIYSGGTTINQGTLAISSDQNLGAESGGLTFNSNLIGTPPTLRFLSDVTTVRSVTLASDGTFDTLDNTATLSGQIAGNGALIKTGTGTLTLTGTNIYSGGTIINQGTLQLGNGGTTGSILGNVADEGTLLFNRSNTLNFDGVISGSGAVFQIGEGTTVLTGANTYSGPTIVSAGTLQAGADNTFSRNSPHVVESDGTLDLAGFDQTVPSLTNAGFVRTGGQADTNLTVTGAYIGQDGILNLNTFLAGDGAPSDKLVIAGGTATGSTGMIITNVGGAGSVTVGNGILVVDDLTGHTTAPGAFQLAAPAVAGPYEYTLERGSLDASGPEDWYLRSALDCAHVPHLPECAGPPGPTPPGLPGPTPPDPLPPPVPNYRQEVSLDMAIQPMAVIYGRYLIDTLHERVGEEEQLKGRADLWQDSNVNGIWGRLIGQYGHRDGDPLGIYGGGPEFDYAFGGLQAGKDFYATEHQGGSRDHAGAYLAFGHGEMDVTHNLLGFEFDGGNDRFNAVSVGGYWTHFGATDWYLDAVAQATYYNMTASSSRGLRDGKTDGVGLAASLETGYPFDLGNGWSVEPQGQLVYQYISFDDLNDGAATVRFEDVDSLAGRIGGRVARTWSLSSEEQGSGATPARLATVWGRVNLWREFLADTTVKFSSASGFIPFSQDLEETWIEGELGASLQLTASTTLYGNVDYQTTFDNDAWSVGGKIGLRVNW
ncbi:autotransporter outer membrane beta-barrel domain-containing protein [Sinorhizobium sp. CB9]